MKKLLVAVALFAAVGVAQAQDPPPHPTMPPVILSPPPIFDMTPLRAREYIRVLTALRLHEVAEGDAERIALKLTPSEFGLWAAQYPNLLPVGIWAVLLLQAAIIALLATRRR